MSKPSGERAKRRHTPARPGRDRPVIVEDVDGLTCVVRTIEPLTCEDRELIRDVLINRLDERSGYLVTQDDFDTVFDDEHGDVDWIMVALIAFSVLTMLLALLGVSELIEWVRSHNLPEY